MSTELNSVVVDLLLDIEKIDSQLSEVEKRSEKTAKMVDKLFASTKLRVNVDHHPLVELNKHIELKRTHVKNVQAYFNANPLKVKADDKQLKAFNLALDAVQAQIKAVQAQAAVPIIFTTRHVEVNKPPQKTKSVEVLQKSRVDLEVTSNAEQRFEQAVERGVKAAKKAESGGLLGLITAPIKVAMDEFVRENARAFARSSGSTKTAASVGKAVGNFTRERGQEFGDHAARNFLMYEDGLKGLQAEFKAAGQKMSNFLHPEPFYAAVDKMETRFAKFLHTTFYSRASERFIKEPIVTPEGEEPTTKRTFRRKKVSGFELASIQLMDDMAASVKERGEKFKSLGAMANTNVAEDLKKIIKAWSKGDKERDEALEAAKPEARVLFKRFVTTAESEVDSSLPPEKKEAKAKETLVSLSGARRVGQKVMRDLADEAGSDDLFRATNALMRVFRVSTNSIRKMNAMEMDKIAEKLADSFTELIPKMTDTRKKLVILGAPGSDDALAGSEQMAAIQATVGENTNVVTAYDKTYNYTKDLPKPNDNEFEKLSRVIAKPFLSTLIPGRGGEGDTGEGAEIISQTMDGMLFGFSRSAANILGIIKAAVKEGYKLEDIQLIGFSQGSQVVRSAVDAMEQLDQHMKGVGVGVPTYFPGLSDPKEYQAVVSNTDQFALMANTKVLPNSAKDIIGKPIVSTKDGHAYSQMMPQAEILNQLRGLGHNVRRPAENHDNRRFGQIVQAFPLLTEIMQSNLLIRNLVGGERTTKDIPGGNAQDFEHLLQILANTLVPEGGKIRGVARTQKEDAPDSFRELDRFSPEKIPETARTAGVDVNDVQALGSGSKLYADSMESVTLLLSKLGIKSKDLATDLGSLMTVFEFFEDFNHLQKQSGEMNPDGTENKATISPIQAASNIWRKAEKLPEGELKQELLNLAKKDNIKGIYKGGDGFLDARNNSVIAEARRVLGFKNEESDFGQDRVGINTTYAQMPESVIYSEASKKELDEKQEEKRIKKREEKYQEVLKRQEKERAAREKKYEEDIIAREKAEQEDAYPVTVSAEYAQRNQEKKESVFLQSQSTKEKNWQVSVLTHDENEDLWGGVQNSREKKRQIAAKDRSDLVTPGTEKEKHSTITPIIKQVTDTLLAQGSKAGGGIISHFESELVAQVNALLLRIPGEDSNTLRHGAKQVSKLNEMDAKDYDHIAKVGGMDQLQKLAALISSLYNVAKGIEGVTLDAVSFGNGESVKKIVQMVAAAGVTNHLLPGGAAMVAGGATPLLESAATTLSQGATGSIAEIAANSGMLSGALTPLVASIEQAISAGLVSSSSALLEFAIAVMGGKVAIDALQASINGLLQSSKIVPKQLPGSNVAGYLPVSKEEAAARGITQKVIAAAGNFADLFSAQAKKLKSELASAQGILDFSPNRARDVIEGVNTKGQELSGRIQKELYGDENEPTALYRDMGADGNKTRGAGSSVKKVLQTTQHLIDNHIYENVVDAAYELERLLEAGDTSPKALQRAKDLIGGTKDNVLGSKTGGISQQFTAARKASENKSDDFLKYEAQKFIDRKSEEVEATLKEIEKLFGKSDPELGKNIAATRSAITRAKNTLPGGKNEVKITEQATEIGTNLAEGTIIGSNSKQPEVVDSARENAEAVLEVQREVFDTHSPSKKTLKIGQDVVAGLLLGLTGGTTEIEAAGALIGESLLGSVEDELEIKSPSRRFLQIGKFCLQGMQKGLEAVKDLGLDFSGLATSATEQLEKVKKSVIEQIEEIETQEAIKADPRIQELRSIHDGAKSFADSYQQDISAGYVAGDDQKVAEATVRLNGFLEDQAKALAEILVLEAEIRKQRDEQNPRLKFDSGYTVGADAGTQAGSMAVQGADQIAQGIDLAATGIQQLTDEFAPLATGAAQGFFDTFSEGIAQILENYPALQDFIDEVVKLGLLGATGAALFAVAPSVIELGKAAIDTSTQLEVMKLNLDSFTDGKGAAIMDRTREAAQRLGVEYLALAEAVSQIQAATINTSLEQQAPELTLDLAQVVSSRGISEANQQRVFLAVTQIAAKGRLSLEELNQQLGEVLPGSLNLAAEAAGKSTAEFIKMVETGNVLSTDILPKLIAKLKEQSQTTANFNTVEKEMTRFKNASTALQESLGELITPAVLAVLSAFSGLLGSSSEEAGIAGVGLGTLSGNADFLARALLTVGVASGLTFAAMFVQSQFAAVGITGLTTLLNIGLKPALLAVRRIFMTFLPMAAVTLAIQGVIELLSWMDKFSDPKLKAANSDIAKSVRNLAEAYRDAAAAAKGMPKPSEIADPKKKPVSDNPFIRFMDSSDIDQKITNSQQSVRNWFFGENKKAPVVRSIANEENKSTVIKAREELQIVTAGLDQNKANLNPERIAQYIKEASALEAKIQSLNSEIVVMQATSEKVDQGKLEALQKQVAATQAEKTQKDNLFLGSGESGLKKIIEDLEKKREALLELVRTQNFSIPPDIFRGIDASIASATEQLVKFQNVTKQVAGEFKDIALRAEILDIDNTDADSKLASQQKQAQVKSLLSQARFEMTPERGALLDANIEKVGYEQKVQRLQDYITTRKELLGELTKAEIKTVEGLMRGVKIEDATSGSIAFALSKAEGDNISGNVVAALEAMKAADDAGTELEDTYVSLAEATKNVAEAQAALVRSYDGIATVLAEINNLKDTTQFVLDIDMAEAEADLKNRRASGLISQENYEKELTDIQRNEIQLRLDDYAHYNEERLKLIRALNQGARQELEGFLGSKAEDATLDQVLNGRTRAERADKTKPVSGDVMAAFDTLEDFQRDLLAAAQASVELADNAMEARDQDIVEITYEQIESIAKGFSDSMKDLDKSYKDYLKGITDQIKDLSKETEQLLEQVDVLDFKNSLKRALLGETGISRQIGDLFGGALEQLIDKDSEDLEDTSQMDDALETAKEGLEGLKEQFSEALKTMGEAIRELGDQTIKGFIEVIKGIDSSAIVSGVVGQFLGGVNPGEIASVAGQVNYGNQPQLQQSVGSEFVSQGVQTQGNSAAANTVVATPANTFNAEYQKKYAEYMASYTKFASIKQAESSDTIYWEEAARLKKEYSLLVEMYNSGQVTPGSTQTSTAVTQTPMVQQTQQQLYTSPNVSSSPVQGYNFDFSKGEAIQADLRVAYEKNSEAKKAVRAEEKESVIIDIIDQSKSMIKGFKNDLRSRVRDIEQRGMELTKLIEEYTPETLIKRQTQTTRDVNQKFAEYERGVGDLQRELVEAMGSDVADIEKLRQGVADRNIDSGLKAEILAAYDEAISEGKSTQDVLQTIYARAGELALQARAANSTATDFANSELMSEIERERGNVITDASAGLLEAQAGANGTDDYKAARLNAKAAEIRQLNDFKIQMQETEKQLRSLGLAGTEEGERIVDALRRVNEIKLDDIRDSADLLKSQVIDLSANAFETFFTDVFQGTKSLSEAFADMGRSILTSLAGLFFKMAAMRLAQSLLGGLNLGGIFSFSDGGTVEGYSNGGTVEGYSNGGTVEGYADGGTVFDKGYTLSGISNALEKEGYNSVLAALTPGEEVLSDKEGDASFYRYLDSQGLWDTLKSGGGTDVSNYDLGGTVGSSGGSGGRNSGGSRGGRGGDVVNVTVYANDVDSFKKSEGQMYRDLEYRQRRSSSRNS